jgi:hypothetical protein
LTTWQIKRVTKFSTFLKKGKILKQLATWCICHVANWRFTTW